MSGPEERRGAALVVDDEGIGWLGFDRSASRVNLLDTPTLRLLDELLGEVESGAATGSLRALIVHSRKPGSFIVGADLDELQAVTSAHEAAARAAEGQQVLRRLEQLKVPSVAALDGTCLGSGTELALACSYRLASDAPHTRMGLPEIRIGIIPGLGGTVRLPRLVGTQAALDLILSGRSVGAKEAKGLGLVDEVFTARHFEPRLFRFVLERVERGRVRSGSARGVTKRLLEDTAPGRRLIFARAGRRQALEAHPDPVVARRAIDAVAEGVALPLERAFEREAEILGELLVSERSRALLHAYRLTQRARRAPAPGSRQIERAAVLGAGATGSAVSYLLLSGGIPVRLRDRKHATVSRSAKQILSWFSEEAGASRISEDQRALRSDNLAGGTGFGGFGTADLAVVAVGADEDDMRAAVLDAEEHTQESCLTAVAGDDLPLDVLQAGSRRPGQLVGVRFAHPVDRFALMEIVPGTETSAQAVAALRDLGRRLGRVPLLVRDAQGGILNRLLAVYFSEALRMLEDGRNVAEIDSAAEGFGWVAGPLRRLDAFGAARAVRLLEQFSRLPNGRVRLSPLLTRTAEGNGSDFASFYLYRNGEALGARPGRAKKKPEGSAAAEVIQHRLLFLLINEAALALEEGTVGGADDVDLASLEGLGFPRGRGGLLFHAERIGAAGVVSKLSDLAGRFGERFDPAPLLLRRAAEAGGADDPPAGHRAAGLL